MSAFQDVVFQWLTTDSIPLNQIDAEDPEVSAKPMLPVANVIFHSYKVMITSLSQSSALFSESEKLNVASHWLTTI